MPTIREIAKATGLSVSTVSIVLRGNVPKGRISQETQTKVRNMAQKMGYQPNLSARRLRSATDSRRIIATFWASDFRVSMMLRLLRGLQETALEGGNACEFVIYPYHEGKLEEVLRGPYYYNAAIVCNTTMHDIRFLEDSDIPVPIVLYNRQSQTISSVSVDNHAIGMMPAKIFASRRHKQVVMITSAISYIGMEQREESFTREVINRGMSVRLLRVGASMEGGYKGALMIAAMDPRPDAVFCLHDSLSVGALKGFAESGIRVPEDLELISVGNGDNDMEQYASTSLSVVHIPMEKMAAECLRLALSSAWGKPEGNRAPFFPVEYICRESCGPMLEDGGAD